MDLIGIPIVLLLATGGWLTANWNTKYRRDSEARNIPSADMLRLPARADRQELR